MKRSFTIDWDSLLEVSSLRKILQERRRELKGLKQLPGNPDPRTNTKLFESCLKVMSTNISHLYQDLSLSENRDYYVYVHMDGTRPLKVFRPLHAFAATLGMTHSPFYVGKGTGKRCNDLCRSETHRKISQRVRSLQSEPLVLKIQDSLTEAEALALESKLIDIFGLLAFGGYLSNLDEGYQSKNRKLLYQEELLVIHGKSWRNVIRTLSTAVE